MILNFDRGYGQSAEQMVQSLMESTQMAFDTLERKLGLPGDSLTDDDGNVITDKIEANNLAVKGELALGTALSIANGGTGATTAAAACSNLGIKDYIVTQGTTNGWDYIKYASRKFIAWKYGTANYTCTNASGSMYYSGISTWKLPFTIVNGVANISLGQQCFASNVVLDTGAINFRALRGAKASLTNVETHIAVHGTY